MSLPSYGASGQPYGATPVSPDEASFLAPGVDPTTKEELDALEEENIEVAMNDLIDLVVDEEMQVDQVLDDLFLREVHRRMFCDVWQWAGQYRKVELSIGVDPAQVSVQTRSLLQDASAWLEFDSYPLVETLVRLSHGIARIHPFRNGNGRLSRLYVDLLQPSMDRELDLSWGRYLELPYEQDKQLYIGALQQADRGDVQPLIRYATSRI